MFDNSSIMVLLANTKTEQVRKLEVNHETQYAVTSTMRNAFDKFAEGKSVIRFNGSYKPNDDEILSIDDFQLSDEIKEAIRDPLGVGSYGKIDGEFPAIKAIFVGERLEDGENEKLKCYR